MYIFFLLHRPRRRLFLQVLWIQSSSTSLSMCVRACVCEAQMLKSKIKCEKLTNLTANQAICWCFDVITKMVHEKYTNFSTNFQHIIALYYTQTWHFISFLQLHLHHCATLFSIPIRKLKMNVVGFWSLITINLHVD